MYGALDGFHWAFVASFEMLFQQLNELLRRISVELQISEVRHFVCCESKTYTIFWVNVKGQLQVNNTSGKS